MAVFAGVCAAPGPRAQAHDLPHVVVAVERGTVDWSEGMITAQGEAAAPAGAANVQVARVAAIRAAREDALRNLVVAVGSVAITSEETIGERMAADDSVSAAVRRIVADAVRVAPPQVIEGTARVAMGVRIAGPLADAVLPAGEPPPALAEGGSANDAVEVNGIVIEAAGLALRPAIAPRIVDPSGTTVYGPSFVSYARSVEDAIHEERAGSHPLVVRVRRALGRNAADVEISAEDAARARAVDAATGCLAAGAVVFVID